MNQEDTKSWWPIGIAVGLGLVVVANVIMISIATSHPSAPASEDHWAESLAYEEVLAERRASAELGWQVEWDGCAKAEDVCEIRLHVLDSSGHPIEGLDGSIRARRHDTTALDRDAPIRADDGPGEYRGVLQLGSAGLYELDLRLQGAGGVWVDQRRMMLPLPEQPG